MYSLTHHIVTQVRENSTGNKIAELILSSQQVEEF